MEEVAVEVEGVRLTSVRDALRRHARSALCHVSSRARLAAGSEDSPTDADSGRFLMGDTAGAAVAVTAVARGEPMGIVAAAKEEEARPGGEAGDSRCKSGGEATGRRGC